MTDPVLERVHDDALLKKLLLEGYFPDLRHLTLPFRLFVAPWTTGVIPMLLDHNRPRPDASNELPLLNIFVKDPRGAVKSLYNLDSEFAKQLKALQPNISLRF